MRLYETHLPVTDLAKSVAFYRDVVGLTPAFAQPERGVAFMWIENKQTGMLGLWRPGTSFGWKGAERDATHFALSVSLDSLITTARKLKAGGITVRNLAGQPTDEVSVIGWMPSAQLYFDDPDGHSVELIAILRGKPVPEFFGTWSGWQHRKAGK